MPVVTIGKWHPTQQRRWVWFNPPLTLAEFRLRATDVDKRPPGLAQSVAPPTLPPADLPNVIRRGSVLSSYRYFTRVPEPPKREATQ
jgi:hypothetical protein